MRTSLPVCLLALAPAAVAMPTDLPTERDYFADFPQVLSASRLPQPLENSPVAVSVIDREMIEASGAREIEELFRLVPGMIVGHENGNEAFVTHHAMADRYARRMQVLVDGRSVYAPTTGGVNWASLPLALEDIERIEVIRGPNAAVYGANAFLGTINIITREPGSRPGTRASLAAGNDEIFRAVAGHDGTAGNAKWRLTAGRWGDAGFAQPGGQEDDKTVSFATGRLDYELARGEVRLFAGAARKEARAGFSAASILEPPHDLGTRQQHLQAEWERQASAAQGFLLRAYVLEADQNETFLTQPLPFLGGAQAVIDRDFESLRRDVEFQHTWTPAGDLRAVWGAGLRQDRMRSRSYFSRDDWLENDQWRLFGHVEWQPAARWIAQAGLMLEGSDIAGEDASPRLALNYRLSPRHSFRISSSKAIRTPVLIEEASNQRFAVGGFFDQVLLASGNLDSEQIVSHELGWLARYPDAGLTLDARLFHDEITDLVTYTVVPYPDPFNGRTLDFRNFDRALIRGAELQADWRPGRDSRLIFNYAYVEIDSEDVDEIYSQSGPRHNTSLLAGHDFGRLDASLGFYYMSEYHGLDTGDPIAATRRVDLRLATSLGDATRLSFTVQALNGEMTDFQDENVLETRAYVRLETTF